MHRLGRILLGAVIAAAPIAVVAQPAQAMNHTTAAAAAWAYTDSAQPTTPRPNPEGDAPTGTIAGAAHRAYFTFDLTPFQGQVLHGASIYSAERTVSDCGSTATVEVWRTGKVTGTTTWRRAPTELEKIGSYDLGRGVICPGATLSIDVLAQVEAARQRREKSVTFGVRIAAGQETEPARARTWRPFRLSVQSNHAPTIGSPVLLDPDRPCGTLAKHPSAGGPSVRFGVTTADADERDGRPDVTYAIWPVERPDQRVEFGRNGGVLNLRDYPDGAVLAWNAQARDFDGDRSPWTKTCYLTVDNTAPAAGPVINSKVYSSPTYPGTGGPGVAGTFVLDAAGDPDVVGFLWSTDSAGVLTYAKAGRPGGKARVAVTPTSSGPKRLRALSIDAAGNRGPEVTYEYIVRDSAPYADVTVGGVGLPSPVTLRTRATEVDRFVYAVDGGAEKTVAAVDGVGTDTLTFTSKGNHSIATRAYAGAKLIGTQTQQITVSDAPKIDSAEFSWQADQILGQAGTFTFTPRTTGVVSYRYDFGDGVEHTTDSATLPWTADRAGYLTLTVRSVTADGTVSDPARVSFRIIDTHPTIEWNDWAGPFTVGEPVSVTLYSGLPDVDSFVYTFDGGAEQVADGNPIMFQVVPERPGDLVLTARAKLPDGTLSPPSSITIHVSTAPSVTVRGPYGPSPILGLPATFTFRTGVAGVTGYRYWWTGGEEQSVAAGPDGSATFTGSVDGISNPLHVVSVTADGARSDEEEFYVSADDPRVEVIMNWSDDSVTFDFYGWMDDTGTRGFRWHVDGVEPQEVPLESSRATFTPTHSGDATLYVQRVFTDGAVGPVTEFPFTVAE